MRHQRRGDPLGHINGDHQADLLIAVRASAGFGDATSAHARGIDRHGIDVDVETPTGSTTARLEFNAPIPERDYPGGVRLAFVRLVRRARGATTTAGEDPSPP